MFHVGNITVGLTALSGAASMARKGKKKMKSEAARAIKTTIAVWACSRCGAKMPLNDLSKPPKRCSNRKSCGAMFANRD